MRRPSTTADTSTFSHFLHSSQPKLKTLRGKIGRDTSTNIGHTFLKLLDAEFTEEHVFHKIFDRNKVKISYSCMPNLKQMINAHNKSILRNKIVASRSFNCRAKTECPMTRIGCLPSKLIRREGASLLFSPIHPRPTHHYQCDVT